MTEPESKPLVDDTELDDTAVERTNRLWKYRRWMAFGALATIIGIACIAVFWAIPGGSAGTIDTVLWVCLLIVIAYFGNTSVADAMMALKGKRV